MHAAIPALQNCQVSEKLKTPGICSTATPSSRATLILAMFILIRKKKKDKPHVCPRSMEHHLAALNMLSTPWQQDGAELGPN